MIHTGLNCLSYTLLIVLVVSHMGHADRTGAVQLHSQFTSLSLPKELLSSSILLVHLEARLMITASERDFPLKTSANSTFHYIHHPQSYRMVLLQASSAMHRMFTDSYSTMYRMQLSMKRIPDHIKTILKLVTQGSPVMIERMLPAAFNSIARLADENEVSTRKNIDQLTNLGNLLEEIRTSLTIQPSNPNHKSSDRTDVALKNRFDSKSALEKMGTMVQGMQRQFEQLAQLVMSLNIKEKFNLTFPIQTACLLPILYTLESTAHFLYQSSSVYTQMLNRHVLDQTAGMGKYILLSTDEERSTTASGLTQQLTGAMHELEQWLIERQDELQSGDMVLRQAYDRLFDRFPHQNCEKANK